MNNRVVVTGIGMVTPLGLDAKSTWGNLLAGKSGISHISSFDADGLETRIAGEVKNLRSEEILGSKAARRLDRFSQMACIASLEATKKAGLDITIKDNDRTAVIIGSGVGGIMTIVEQHKIMLEKGHSRVNPFTVPMMLGDMASGQVSIMLGVKGPNFSIVSACATGADAIGEAAAIIRLGRVDAAIAGGSEAAICKFGIASFNACLALSKRNEDPETASRPFDAGRDGFVLGEGAGVLVLESLEHAEARGAKPLCEMAGYGAASDAYHVTQPHPDGEGAASAMRYALIDAGMEPNDISYINAHGTSTKLNDKIETKAVKKIFGEHSYKIPISSTKSMMGHPLGAAGSIEAVISVMAITESAIPPTINLTEPDPDCDLNYVPYTAQRGKVSAVMSNSLGFGGHNTSLIFKEFVD